MPTHKQLTDSRGLTPKQQAFLDSVARHLGMFAKDAGQVAPQVILNINLGHQQIQTGVKRANPQGESQ